MPQQRPCPPYHGERAHVRLEHPVVVGYDGSESSRHALAYGAGMARRLSAGVVWINSFADTETSVAFGGTKQSGYGRECGEESIHTYTQTKSVYCRL